MRFTEHPKNFWGHTPIGGIEVAAVINWSPPF
jgi:hypothetical protein